MSLPELFRRTRQPLNIRATPPNMALEALPGNAVMIPFDMQRQKAEFWCWAAVASSVSRHYKSASQWTQCLVANEVLGAGHCCLNQTSPTCNLMSSLEAALTTTSNLVPNGVLDGPASPDQLRTQIRDAKRVVGCGIRWPDLRGHFVVIHGFSIDMNGILWVAVADPRYGPSQGPYTAFVNRYRGNGRWVVSYATKP